MQIFGRQETDASGAPDWAFHYKIGRATGTYSNLSTAVDFSNHSRAILENAYVKEAGPSPQGNQSVTYSLPPYGFSNQLRGTYMVNNFTADEVWAHVSSCIALKLDNVLGSNIGIISSGLLWCVAICSIKRNLSAQYGGNTYNDRAINNYISTNMIIDPNVNGGTIDVYGGDTYVCGWGIYNTMDLMDDDVPKENRTVSKTFVVVESSINLTLEHSNNNMRRGFFGNNFYTQEKSGIYDAGYQSGTVPQDDDYFLYNSVYSREPDILTSIAEPIDIAQGLRNDVKIKASQMKYNGEIFYFS